MKGTTVISTLFLLLPSCSLAFSTAGYEISYMQAGCSGDPREVIAVTSGCVSNIEGVPSAAKFKCKDGIPQLLTYSNGSSCSGDAATTYLDTGCDSDDNFSSSRKLCELPDDVANKKDLFDLSVTYYPKSAKCNGDAVTLTLQSGSPYSCIQANYAAQCQENGKVILLTHYDGDYCAGSGTRQTVSAPHCLYGNNQNFTGSVEIKCLAKGTTVKEAIHGEPGPDVGLIVGGIFGGIAFIVIAAVAIYYLVNLQPRSEYQPIEGSTYAEISPSQPARPAQPAQPVQPTHNAPSYNAQEPPMAQPTESSPIVDTSNNTTNSES